MGAGPVLSKAGMSLQARPRRASLLGVETKKAAIKHSRKPCGVRANPDSGFAVGAPLVGRVRPSWPENRKANGMPF
jgi:hypothetical protein